MSVKTKVLLNDAYKHHTGGGKNYYIGEFPNLLYTAGVQEIMNVTQLQPVIIPEIGRVFEKIKDPFQIWTLERVVEGDKITNDFILYCHTESDYLNSKDDVKDSKILRFAFPFYELNVKFDRLNMWVSNNLLMLPSEY
ncbi:hypothetical protein HX049_17055 [Myroides odoratimimus]|uniref:DUF6876 family protein n=1 Tax=Myroides odoratimimus TaxID=76832 RepID=UPI0025783182|nr:DUF6876 family protein [Myroides odoratimimus]MDM1398853.1 hypothetical protein [Myroides odoratimimus]